MERPDPDTPDDDRPRPDEDLDADPGDDVSDAPAAGVLFPDLDDPPEPNEPG